MDLKTRFFQSKFDTLKLKKHEGNDYVLSWKLKGVSNIKLKELNTAFVHDIKPSAYTIEIKFDKDPLAVEQNNYLTKIVNVYIVYDLAASPRNLTINFKFKNWSLGPTSTVKYSDKEKYVYSGYAITFDSEGSWSFNNSTARNIVIFGFDNNSSSHSDNCKNNFLILGEFPIFEISGSFGWPQKKFSVNFS